MQIQSGKFRGKKITLPPKNITRPTSQRASEALFSSLESNYKHFDLFVDAFAGSGAIGITALSKNLADFVIFTESDPQVFKILKSNSASLKDTKNYKIADSDFFKYIKTVKNLKNAVIFMDPPFEDTLTAVRKLKQLLPILDKSTLIVIESELPEIQLPEGLELIKSKKYGRINFFFIKNT
ncbi:MAG: RsmD family RNA methyltransferase [Rickettsiales bacterium]|jgi:16S rRNA (guanine966-N2)-methyltransferase|nr:RsmD family RNA methyltransferase [Rickettsiales bacterium]